ncbi:MAG: hypothetical protein JST16_15895 [Bdellovibrionales bacterium]|nr:hypothetical protein [Bdellovibrionales bacterium]
MRQNIGLRVSCLVPLALAACGGGSKSNPPNATPDPVKVAPSQTPQEALARLNEVDREHFESWKSRLEKSCDANAIFDDKSATSGVIPTGIDLALFLNASGRSLLITDTQGNGFVVGSPEHLTGSATSSLQRTVTVNNVPGYAIEAHTKSLNGHCEMWIDGQKVYDNLFVARLPVLAAWGPASSAKPAGVFKPQMTTARTNAALATLGNQGFAAQVWKALAPSPNSILALGARFGLSGEATSRLFFASPTVLDHSAWLGAAGTLPFNNVDDRIVGPKATLNDLVSGEKNTKVVVRAVPPVLVEEGLRNDADTGLWEINATVHSAPADTNAFAYSVVGSPAVAAVNADDTYATTCLTSRLNSLQEFETVDGNHKRVQAPLFAQVSAPCRALSHDFYAATLNSEMARTAIMNVFLGVQPSHATDYRGWDVPFVNFVDRLTVLSRPAKLREYLDPDTKLPMVTAADAYVNEFVPAFESFATLKAYSHEATFTGARWALRGDVVTSAQMSRMARSLQNSMVPFVASTLHLLSDLSDDPSAFDAQLSFAENMNATYKQAGESVMAGAHLFGLESWLARTLDLTLQNQIPAAQLLAWGQTFSAAAAFADRDRARATANDASVESDIGTVLVRALDETWTASQFAALENITTLGRVRIGCPYGPAASVAVKCVAFSAFSTADGKFFAPSFGDRYSVEANSFLNYQASLPRTTYGDMADRLVDAFFAPVWSHCVAADFTQKSTDMGKNVQALRNATDLFGRRAAEQNIEKTLQDCS